MPKRPTLNLQAIQEIIDFNAPSRPRNVFVVAITTGPYCIAASYEGDLAINGSVGPHRFENTPLHLAYSHLLKAYLDSLQKAIHTDDMRAIAGAIVTTYKLYCKYGLNTHRLATPVCCDQGRLTSATGFLNNYAYTLVHLTRIVLGDGVSTRDRVQIDQNLAGIEEFDGLGVEWGAGMEPGRKITKVQRTDLSKGLGYSSERENSARENPREKMVVSQFTEKEHHLPEREAKMNEMRAEDVKSSSPNQIIHPLSDCIRATSTWTASKWVQTQKLLARMIRECEIEDEC